MTVGCRFCVDVGIAVAVWISHCRCSRVCMCMDVVRTAA